jgi:LuxR family transcriptional regulator, maltose regulon positive regulatory protein
LDNEATPLTLVCAPVGWGKTSLLAAWVCDPRETRSVAWLSLDGDDDEPGRFWRYVVAALRQALPEVGRVAAGAATIPGADPIATIVQPLLNDLATSERPAVLVLDDYHLIADPRVHEGVEYLLTYLPLSLRVVLAARHDPPLPLPRLRARGQLTDRSPAGRTNLARSPIGRRSDPRQHNLGEVKSHLSPALGNHECHARAR